MSNSNDNPAPKPTKLKTKEELLEENAREIGGYKEQGLPEPTRFGDWEVKGRCSDF